MGHNVDGTANCDRCGIHLAGYGVLYGMVCTDIDPLNNVRELIFCYVNNCRAVVTQGMVNFLGDDTVFPPRCTDCDEKLGVRGIAEAMLAADIQAATTATARQLTFCYVNGSRDKLLTQATL